MHAVSTLEHWEQVLEQAAAGAAAPPPISAAAKGRQIAQPTIVKPRYSLLTPRDADATGSRQQQQQQQDEDGFRQIYPSGIVHRLHGKLGSASEVSDAWQEVAHAAEIENASLKAELEALKEEHAKAKEETARLKQKLQEAETSAAAYREASQGETAAHAAELRAALEKAESASGKRADLLTVKADAAVRDAASLRAQHTIDRVHRTTLEREVALLDGSVGFLATRLSLVQKELASTRAAHEEHRTRTDAASIEGAAAVLNAKHINTVLSAQKRTIADLREHASAAQGLAHEAREKFTRRSRRSVTPRQSS